MWFWFWVHGSGWAEAGIGDDVGHANLTASYLSDALGDLLYAVLRCANGAPEARCSWEDEPREYRWILGRDGDQVHLRILGFDDVYERRPDEAGELLFETRQDWVTVARSIALGASRTLEKHGEDGYRNQWGYPFPIATLALIRAGLDAASEADPTG
jgi:hypothetical protein